MSVGETDGGKGRGEGGCAVAGRLGGESEAGGGLVKGRGDLFTGEVGETISKGRNKVVLLRRRGGGEKEEGGEEGEGGGVRIVC